MKTIQEYFQHRIPNLQLQLIRKIKPLLTRQVYQLTIMEILKIMKLIVVLKLVI